MIRIVFYHAGVLFLLIVCHKESTGPMDLSIAATDIDGNVYQTVQIGRQWWMAENLKARHYRNGDAIPEVTDNSEWEGLNTGAYSNFDNDSGNVQTRGRLYNWYAVNHEHKIAPAGWHVATDQEWCILVDFCGGDSVAGEKLRAVGAIFWTNSTCTRASNESGFTAVAGGFRDKHGIYRGKNSTALFWTSSEFNSDSAYSRIFRFDCPGAYAFIGSKHYGFSIRCVRD
jgi:uncharacterized protein (TIGR02145 family)